MACRLKPSWFFMTNMWSFLFRFLGAQGGVGRNVLEAFDTTSSWESIPVAGREPFCSVFCVSGGGGLDTAAVDGGNLVAW